MNETGELCLTINIDVENTAFTPTQDQVELWISKALFAGLPEDSPYLQHAELSITLLTAEAMAQLNKDYRNKDKTTNVLSFPTDFPEELAVPLLGDIIICPSVLENEAQEQNKTLESHWAHLCIHGCLHLLGFDHTNDKEAEIMESLETKIMLSLNYPAPY